jgi:hypothetical protein
VSWLIAAHALEIESGSDSFLKDLTSEVVNGELRFRMRDKHSGTTHKDERIVISMPDQIADRE